MNASVMRAIALAAGLLTAGCAGAMPALVGGSTTPTRRSDLIAGGSARVPRGDLRREASTTASGSNAGRAGLGGGIVPTAAVRIGLPNGFDVGMIAAGTDVRAEIRRERVLRNGSTRPSLLATAAIYGGAIRDRDDDSVHARRIGGELIGAWAAEFGGLYDAWLGLRIAAEGVNGNLGPTATNATALGARIGPVLGLAAGFRWVHALIEMTVAFEDWRIEDAAGRRNVYGFVFIPAFVIRLRI
jgi:hypothetical protein